MPPRKKSRVTLAEENKPTVFKALCLPNTGFMVDFLGYFTRDDFEKYLKLTCKRINQLILTHFHSKPYRYLDNFTLTCNLNFNIRQCCMMMCLKKQTTDNNFSTIFWDPYKLKWGNVGKYEVGFPTMSQFLDKTVRVSKVNIWICYDTIMTQELIDQLKSLSHVWENAQVEFTTGRYEKENLASRAEMLSEAKVFRCQSFKCSYTDVMLPLWDYPESYSLEAIKFDIFSLTSEESDLTPLIQLIENQALYPNSQTIFKFMESDKAQSFRIIFAIYVGSELPAGEMDEFLLENNRTREVLQLRLVTYNDVAKFCEFKVKTKYFILERSHV